MQPNDCCEKLKNLIPNIFCVPLTPNRVHVFEENEQGIPRTILRVNGDQASKCQLIKNLIDTNLILI